MLGEGFATGQEIARDTNIVFWVLMLFNLIVIGVIITVKTDYLKTLFNTLIFNRYLIYNSQENLHLNKGVSLLFTLTFFTTVAAGFARFTDASLSSIFIGTAGLALLVLIKVTAIHFVGIISNNKSGLTEHLLNHHVFFQSSAFILTLVLLFSFALSADYHYILFWIFAVIVIMGTLFREFQTFIRAINSKVSLFYIILYLCTLEIVPFLIVLRVIASENAVLN